MTALDSAVTGSTVSAPATILPITTASTAPTTSVGVAQTASPDLTTWLASLSPAEFQQDVQFAVAQGLLSTSDFTVHGLGKILTARLLREAASVSQQLWQESRRTGLVNSV